MLRSWWPIKPRMLDNRRLVAEHNELQVIAIMIFNMRINRSVSKTFKKWTNHPEVKRWIGHTRALKVRHDHIVAEMLKRLMNHNTPWESHLIDETDDDSWPDYHWDPLPSLLGKLNERQNTHFTLEEILS